MMAFNDVTSVDPSGRTKGGRGIASLTEATVLVSSFFLVYFFFFGSGSPVDCSWTGTVGIVAATTLGGIGSSFRWGVGVWRTRCAIPPRVSEADSDSDSFFLRRSRLLGLMEGARG
jgi:TM2 domain-containing membrane protein YozV